VSPATIRNTMSDLEEKGYLFHPHTSAGRIPTSKAYRAYVDALIRRPDVASEERYLLSEQLRAASDAGSSAIEAILRRAAQSLGIVAQELGVAVGPRLERSVLQRLELVRLSNDRLLMVLTLANGVMPTIFVEVRGEIAESALGEVTRVLNERLAGVPLAEIRATLGARLRDTLGAAPEARELLNIFVQQGEQLFDLKLPLNDASVVLGQPSVLTEQPEFAEPQSMKRLIELTERPGDLAELLRQRPASAGLTITIGKEHQDPRLEDFTVVTAEYHVGDLAGVIGVIGPTRMPYEKVISLVDHTSRLLTDLLD
jgi:heat-inducible transcriptional repressor